MGRSEEGGIGAACVEEGNRGGGRFRLIYPPRRQELGWVGDILQAGKWVVICVIDIFFVRRCEDSFFFCKFAFEKNGHYE